jgi:hypothetical protein
VVSGYRFVAKQVAMGLRKKIANKILGADIDDLCLGWYEQGLAAGFDEGMDRAVNDIVTDLLSDATLSLEVDTDILQRIVEIIEN